MNKVKIYFVILLLSVATIVSAGTIHVPGDQPTIQAGIDAASNGDTVLVANGTYTGTGNRDIDFNGKAITVKSENGADYCIINCQGTEADPHRGFKFHSGEGNGSVLQGFTIRNGYADGPDFWEDRHGGGIFCEDCSPVIQNNHITANTVHPEGYGLGIYCYLGQPMILENTISFNQIYDTLYGGGAGIYCAGSAIIRGNVVIYNYHYRQGGGIFAVGSPLIEGNVIENNGAYYHGGGISNLQSATIRNNIITDNHAKSGGGIFYGGGSEESPVIENNIISGNECWDEGAGILIQSGTIINNWIFENNAGIGRGGGIDCTSGYPYLLMKNNVIFGNEAQCGGGISCGGAITMINNTIFGNTAKSAREESDCGGGIYCYNDSSMTITNTILWANKASSGKGIYIASIWGDPSTLTISYSDVEGGQSLVYVEPDCTLNWGDGMIEGDPLFIDPDNDDYHLRQTPCQFMPWGVSNPCVDSGDPLSAIIHGSTRTDEVTDLGIVDMGFHYLPDVWTDQWLEEIPDFGDLPQIEAGN